MQRFATPVRWAAAVAIAAACVFAFTGAALAEAPSPSPSGAATPASATATSSSSPTTAASASPTLPATATATASATPIPNVPTPPPGPLQPTDRLITALDMSGTNEVPPVTTTAIGNFRATLTGSTLCYTFGAEGVGLTMAHIYHGAAGTNGDPVVQLFMDVSGVNEIMTSGCISAVNIGGSLAGDWAGFMQALDSGDLYVQVRSLTHPAGEIRGQLFHSPGPGRVATLTPAAATTPGAPNLGTGGVAANGGQGGWFVAAGSVVIAAIGALGGWAALRRRMAR